MNKALISLMIILLFVLSSCGEGSTKTDNDSFSDDNDIETGDETNDEAVVNADDWLEIKTEKTALESYKDVIESKGSKWSFEDHGFFKTFKTVITWASSFVTGVYISDDSTVYISGLICDGSEEEECSFLAVLHANGDRTDYYLKKHTEGSFSSKIVQGEKGDGVYVLLNYAGESGEGFSECADNRVLLISLTGGQPDSGTVIEPVLDKCHKCYDMESYDSRTVLLCLTGTEKFPETTVILLIGSDRSFRMSEKLYGDSFPFHAVKNKDSLALYSRTGDGLKYIEHTITIKNGEINIEKDSFQKPGIPSVVRRIAHSDMGNRVFIGQDDMEIDSKQGRFDNITSFTHFGTSAVFDRSGGYLKTTRVLTQRPTDTEKMKGPDMSSINYAFENDGITYYAGHSTFDAENRKREWSPFFQVPNPVPADMLMSTFVFAEKEGSIYVRQLISDIIPEYPLVMTEKDGNLFIAGVYYDGNYRQGVFIHEMDEESLLDNAFLSSFSIFSVCGNGLVELGEKCDGPAPCSMISDLYSGGTAQCDMCTKWSTKECVRK